MAPMLGVERASWACCRPHTHGHRKRNGSTRSRERRAMRGWLDEYEEREPVECYAHLSEYFWEEGEPPTCMCSEPLPMKQSEPADWRVQLQQDIYESQTQE